MGFESQKGFLDEIEFGFDKTYHDFIDRIDNRIGLLKDDKDKVSALDGHKIENYEKPGEISRLEDLKKQYKEAAEKGKISGELFDKRYTF